MSIEITPELLQKVLNEEFEEKLFTGNTATSVTYGKVAGESVPAGHEGVVIGFAVSSEDAVVLYLKRGAKDVYENGLNCGGLSHVPETGTDQFGVGPEVPALVKLKEKTEWELGFKATAATPAISWRIRVRYIKKV